MPSINHNITDVHRLVSTILTVIPIPLTTGDYNNESFITHHVLHNCLVQFNHSLQQIQLSLVQLSTLLTGRHDTINDDQLDLLQCLLTNRAPNCWHSPLNLPTSLIDLTDYLQIIQRMAGFMRECLYQQPAVLNITYVPNIAGLLQQFKLHYCTANDLLTEEGSLLCEVRFIVSSSLY